MKYSEKFSFKKYHFLDFQAKIMLGVVNKNCLQLNNSQLLLLESVSCVQLYSFRCVHIPSLQSSVMYRQVFFASLSKTPGGSGQVELCVRVRVPGCGCQLIVCTLSD